LGKFYTLKGCIAKLAIPYFDLPLNLPHAGRIAERIGRLVEQYGLGSDLRWLPLAEITEELDRLLTPYRVADEDPPEGEAEPIRVRAAELGRQLASEAIKRDLREDRFGQCVRNLFECLALGEEGAILSLRVGENPRSLQRPS
jgi:hypothetical protein